MGSRLSARAIRQNRLPLSILLRWEGIVKGFIHFAAVVFTVLVAVAVSAASQTAPPATSSIRSRPEIV
jgi:hypothetical protein